VVQYAVGEFVYLQREMVDTLDTGAGARFLRVKAVAPNKVLELEGSDAADGLEARRKVCPMPSGGHRRPRGSTGGGATSTRCRKASGAARMLLCDGCGAGWHLECPAAPLAAVPEGDWYCDLCREGQAEAPLAVLPATQ
jgi:hypothetical protein